jgi:hypothetical protein
MKYADHLQHLLLRKPKGRKALHITSCTVAFNTVSEATARQHLNTPMPLMRTPDQQGQPGLVLQ